MKSKSKNSTCNRPWCSRNLARNSSVVNSGGLIGHRFRRIFIYYRGKIAPGTKRLCRYNETYVIRNYVIIKLCQTLSFSPRCCFSRVLFLFSFSFYFLTLGVISSPLARPTSQNRNYLFSHNNSHQFLNGIGQITLLSWCQVINMSCLRQSGLRGQNSPVQGSPTSTVSTLCSRTTRQLCRLNSLNGQPSYLGCNSWGCDYVLGAQSSLSSLIGEMKINEL